MSQEWFADTGVNEVPTAPDTASERLRSWSCRAGEARGRALPFLPSPDRSVRHASGVVCGRSGGARCRQRGNLSVILSGVSEGEQGAIRESACSKLGLEPAKALMVGDSW